MGPTTTSDPRRTVSTTGGVEDGGLSSSSPPPPGHDSQVDYKLRVAQEVFALVHGQRRSHGKGKEQEKQELVVVDMLVKKSMGPMYERLVSTTIAIDDMVLQRMVEENGKALKELDEGIAHCVEHEGEMEVRDAVVAKAEYLADIGDVERAQETFEDAFEKTAGSGPKLDLSFSLLRLYLAVGDLHAYRKELERAWDLCGKGGDWERKNKLKVYQAVYYMATRQAKAAAELFLNSIATFTATELMSYEMCVFYTVVLAVISLDRPALMENVVENPEILAAIDVIPCVKELLMSLYTCQYGEFFKALAGISDAIDSDMWLHPHYSWYLKEARVVVYGQYLQSYTSVKIAAMASTFGVSVEFLDDELSDLIVQKRIPAKLDRVDGVIYTTRPDPKNAAYQQAIRQGDHVLNKIQKLSKLADVE